MVCIARLAVKTRRTCFTGYYGWNRKRAMVPEEKRNELFRIFGELQKTMKVCFPLDGLLKREKEDYEKSTK